MTVMSQEEVSPKVIERIRKLLALGDKSSGATEAEAELAMAKAEEMAAEYNISFAQIDMSGGEQKEGGKHTKVESTSETKKQRRAQYKYQQNLMMALAKANFCHADIKWKYSGGRSRRPWGYIIIGRESNIGTTQVMFDYLMNTIDRLVMNEINNDYTQRMSRWAMSWCEGCSDRLVSRIEERHSTMIATQKKEAEAKRKEQETRAQHPAAASSGTSLVVVLEDYEQQEKDYINDIRLNVEPGTTTRKRNTVKARYAEAIAAGKSEDVAQYYSIGYTMERAEQIMANREESARKLREEEANKKPETEAQRRKREEKEARQDERWRRQWRNQQRREDSRRNWEAYDSGSKAANNIGLDRQVGAGHPGAKKLK